VKVETKTAGTTNTGNPANCLSSWLGIVAARTVSDLRLLEQDGILCLSCPQRGEGLPGILVAHGFAGSKQWHGSKKQAILGNKASESLATETRWLVSADEQAKGMGVSTRR